METLVLTRVFNNLRRKKLLTPDIIFIIYTTISWGGRSILNFILLEKILTRDLTVITTFFFSVFITIFLVVFCVRKKIDWYGKEKKDVIPALRKVSKNNSFTNFLFFSFLLVFDSFFFYIYFKNGSTKTIWQIFTWWLTLISLALNSFLWLYFGDSKEKIEVLPLILVTMIILFVYRYLKKWAEKFLEEPTV